MMLMRSVGVPDAIAEFIDNSLQATQNNVERRTIQISFDLNFYSGSSYLTICDNGRGMSESEIMRFARYCDQKEYEDDSSQNPTNISKFGVGSKEAGFYLADRLHVLTKCQESDEVIELVLDESEMEEKQRTNPQNVSLLVCLSFSHAHFFSLTPISSPSSSPSSRTSSPSSRTSSPSSSFIGRSTKEDT
jgi:hypothetical protein